VCLASLQMGPKAQTQPSQMVMGQRQVSPEESRLVKIINDKRVAGKRQYRVKYADGKFTIVTGLIAHC